MDNKQKILLFIAKNMNKKHSILEISKKLNIPYTTTLRSTKTLFPFLHTEPIGQTKAVTLNTNNDLNIAHLAITSEQEKKEYIKTNTLIRMLTNECTGKDIVILFGSYANNKQTNNSDIDIMIINKKGEKTIHFFKQELIFNKKINTMYVSQKEFIQMLQDEKENVGKQVLKNNIIINNPLKFWELVIHATR